MRSKEYYIVISESKAMFGVLALDIFQAYATAETVIKDRYPDFGKIQLVERLQVYQLETQIKLF